MYLLSDPRPDIEQDSNLWTKLFRLIPKLDDKEKAELLHKRLWTIRALGTMLKQTREGLKFIPIVGEKCNWIYEIDFEEAKHIYLKPYAAEISELLRKVNDT